VENGRRRIRRREFSWELEKKKKTTIYKGKWRLSYKSNLFLLAFFKRNLKKKNDKNNS
jgi:hypothetical protein